ncbi:hypothetical protein NQ315_001556 [Exocentrus adspersus]|uniref:cAMP-regulated phosphoprotein 19 n=1 Tax=Exocentrus adspersus TaxID=1586481 RepID=A0AAV8W930_9CUCU|nr:hypothetical protein NQ315_001556 [Exocentrus adspersus]
MIFAAGAMTDQEPDQSEPMQEELSPQELEKQEEAKLKAKYAVPGAPPPRLAGGHSAFLQKRLAKGQKFFDSGDYQMAKQKMGSVNKPSKAPGPAPFTATGEAIPTPETVPTRKTSIVQPSKLTSNAS